MAITYPGARRPNFLVILTDQHRADHLGCAGNGIVRTPHIDGLAAAGRAPSPELGEARLGIWHNGRYDQENTLLWQADPAHAPARRTLSDVVRGRTGPGGAACVSAAAGATILPDRLFPGSAPSLHATRPVLGHVRPGFDPVPTSLGSAGVTPALTRLRAERAAGRANTLGTMPFAVDERESREAIALSYGMISMVDDGIGRILQTLAEVGQLDNTVVIFTSDHGDFMGDHGLMLKSTLHYQGLVRVPFIWSEPGLPQPGVATAALHSTLDVARSVLARAGLQPYWGMQGMDLAASLADPAAAGQSAVLVEEDGHEVGFGFDAPARRRGYVRYSARIGACRSMKGATGVSCMTWPPTRTRWSTCSMTRHTRRSVPDSSSGSRV